MKLVFGTLLWSLLVFFNFIELSLQVFDLNSSPPSENHPQHENNVPVNPQINNNSENRELLSRIASRRASNVQTSMNSQLVDQSLSAGNGNHQVHNNIVNTHDVNYDSPVRMDVQLLPRRILGNNIGPLHGVLVVKDQHVFPGRPAEASATNQEVLPGFPVGIRRPVKGNARLPVNHN